MIETAILKNVEKLPDSAKQEVLHYTEFLIEKYAKQAQQEQPQKKKRKAGLLKGKIWMSDDFDEPLEDFQKYMK